MVQQVTIGDQILEVVRANPGCTMDELTHSLSGVTWSETFLEVGRMSRSGQLRLFKGRAGIMIILRAA